MELTRQEIEAQIEAQQRIQMVNPPASKQWQDAHDEMFRLIELLIGKKPQDACGR